MKRILRATLSVPASAASATVNGDVTQVDLEAAVPVGGFVTPTALFFLKDPAGDSVKLEQVITRNTKNTEHQRNVIPKGTGLLPDEANAVVKPEAGGIDSTSYPVGHGLRIECVVSNSAASARSVGILIVVENQIFGEGAPAVVGVPEERATGLVQLPRADMVDYQGPSFRRTR